MHRYIKKILISFSSLLIVTLSACSATSSTPLIASALGGVGGLVFGDRIGTGNIKVGSAIGAGAGAIAGLAAGKIYQKKQKEELVRQMPSIRTPDISNNSHQEEINRARKELYESTNCGRAETSTWEERYLDYEPNYPYQGPSQ